MYQKFYHFSGIPFLLTPDSRFFFGSSGHSRAIAHLVYGLAQEEGFIVITGEVGRRQDHAGGATLVAARPPHLFHRPHRHHAGLAATTCCAWSMANFGIGDTPGLDKATLLRRFEAWCRSSAAAGRRCLLVVDEVQNLSLAALEELRMLSNITVDGHASLQTILLGQPQFRPILASPDAEQLRQRVLASYHLGPLTEDGDARLYRAPAEDGRLGRRSALGRRRLRRGLSPHRRHPAPDQHALLARPAVWRAGGGAHHHRADGRDDGGRTEPGSRRRLGAGGWRRRAAVNGGAGEPIEAMLRRIEALEASSARQDRVFRRMLDLFGAISGAAADEPTSRTAAAPPVVNAMTVDVED